MQEADIKALEEMAELFCEGGRVTKARWAKFVLHFRAEAIEKHQWPALDFEQAHALHKASPPWFHGFIDRQTAERRLRAIRGAPESSGPCLVRISDSQFGWVLSFATGDGSATVPEHAIFGNHRPGDKFIMETTPSGQLTQQQPLPEPLTCMMDQRFFYDTRRVP
jgi:hypothetical protein